MENKDIVMRNNLFDELYRTKIENENNTTKKSRSQYMREKKDRRKEATLTRMAIPLREVLTRTSSDLVVSKHFGTDLDKNLCRLIKRNIDFFKTNYKVVAVLRQLDEMRYGNYKSSRIKSFKDLSRYVNNHVGRYLAQSAWVVLCEVKLHIDTEDFVNLYFGGNLKEIVQEQLKLDNITKKQWKQFVKSEYSCLSQILFQMYFSDMNGWRKLAEHRNIVERINGYTTNLKESAQFVKLIDTYYQYTNHNSNKILELMDYMAVHNYTERADLYGIGGRRIAQIVDIWHDQVAMSKDKRNAVWTSRNYSLNDIHTKEFKDREGNVYDTERYFVVELCTSSELSKEGRTQSHCVYSYVNRCISGGTSIVSLRKSSNVGLKYLVTIEINNTTGTIVQVQAKGNTRPSKFEMSLISKYADSKNLKFPLWS